MGEAWGEFSFLRPGGFNFLHSSPQFGPLYTRLLLCQVPNLRRSRKNFT